MNKIKKRDLMLYLMVVILLGAAFAMIMSTQVKSRTREAVLFDNSRYAQAEQQYKKQVQEVLQKYGCVNSGLTMTRMVSLEEEREYSMQIYNGKIRLLEREDVAKMMDEIEECKVVTPYGAVYSVEVSYNR